MDDLNLDDLFEIFENDDEKDNNEGIDRILEGSTLFELLEVAMIDIENMGVSDYSETRLNSYIAEMLEITPLQSLIFTTLFIHSIEENYSISLSNFAGRLEMNNMQLLKYYEDLRTLDMRRLIDIEAGGRQNDIRFNIPRSTFSLILSGDDHSKLDTRPKDFAEYTQAVHSLFRETTQDRTDFEARMKLSLDLLDMVKDLPEIKWLKSIGLYPNDILTVALVTYKKIRSDDDSVSVTEIMERVCFEAGETLRLRNELIRGRHVLVRKNVVEIVSGYFLDGRCISLTELAADKLLGGLDEELKKKTELKFKYLIHFKSEKIGKKTLHFDDELKSSLSRVSKILKPRKFREFQMRSSEKGLNSGLISLLYGVPGTGKTEFVKQLARTTGRDVLMVNISDIRDKFVGESEKRLSSIFDEYQKACNSLQREPILVFNEADALISRRTGVGNSVDQMNNSMQNILLQKMEDFQGIMFATTNLKGTMDKAFERRFTLKIRFGRPSKKIQAKLIKSKLSGLKNGFVKFISENYSFTGGQLDNIAKNLEIKEILGEEIDLNYLQFICNQENSEKRVVQRNQVGFRLETVNKKRAS